MVEITALNLYNGLDIWDWQLSCEHIVETPEYYFPGKCPICGQRVNKASALMAINDTWKPGDYELKEICNWVYKGLE